MGKTHHLVLASPRGDDLPKGGAVVGLGCQVDAVALVAPSQRRTRFLCAIVAAWARSRSRTGRAVAGLWNIRNKAGLLSLLSKLDVPFRPLRQQRIGFGIGHQPRSRAEVAERPLVHRVRLHRSSEAVRIIGRPRANVASKKDCERLRELEATNQFAQASRSAALAKHELEADLPGAGVVDDSAGNGHRRDTAGRDDFDDNVSPDGWLNGRENQSAAHADFAHLGFGCHGVVAHPEPDRQANRDARMLVVSAWQGVRPSGFARRNRAWRLHPSRIGSKAPARTRRRGKAGRHDITTPRRRTLLGSPLQASSTTTCDSAGISVVVGQKIPRRDDRRCTGFENPLRFDSELGEYSTAPSLPA